MWRKEVQTKMVPKLYQFDAFYSIFQNSFKKNCFCQDLTKTIFHTILTLRPAGKSKDTFILPLLEANLFSAPCLNSFTDTFTKQGCYKVLKSGGARYNKGHSP